MDAKKFGEFIVKCRKENNMTQADLAVKINVTDKAVSRWERGIGFPDINTIEPLACALGISVLELMKSEKITTGAVANEEATEVVADALNVAKQQRKQERKNAILILGRLYLLFLSCSLTAYSGRWIRLFSQSLESLSLCSFYVALSCCWDMRYGEK